MGKAELSQGQKLHDWTDNRLPAFGTGRHINRNFPFELALRPKA